MKNIKFQLTTIKYWGVKLLMNSKALTKIQALILISVIVVAALGGAIAYIFLEGQDQSSDTIRIGVLGNFDFPSGEGALRGTIMAAEQINAEGGIFGKEVEVIGEQSDLNDLSVVNTALIKLLTSDKVDFVLVSASGQAGLVCQNVIAEHKKIMLGIQMPDDVFTERVGEDYEEYKYFFRIAPINTTVMFSGIPFCTSALRQFTGFNKIGILAQDSPTWEGVITGLEYFLPEVYGFDLVYKGKFPPQKTVDFSSYFAAAEEAEVEILLTLISGTDGILVLKEYADRESPMVIWGLNSAASSPDFWEETDGKCKYTSYIGGVLTGEGYPLTNHTIQYIEEYTERWNDELGDPSGYNALRYILYDAINRAGTIETEAVIKALEETSIETVDRREFEFTSNHDILIAQSWDPETTSSIVFQFQSEGERVPVYPIKIKEEVGGSYIYPPWSGPWDNIS